MTNYDRARAMRADMLTSLAKVRDAYQVYLRVREESRDRVWMTYNYPPDEPLRPDHAKLAEQNADRNSVSIEAVSVIRAHQPLALTFGVAYLVEVDHAWRLESGDGEPGTAPTS
jgi:hypothetical protein